MPWLDLTDGARVRAVAAVVVAVSAAAGIVGLAWILFGSSVAEDQVTGRAPVGPLSDGYTVWERNHDGEPVRWDPCAPIVLVHNLDDGPADLRDDLAEAVTRLRVASGLELIVAGPVDEQPRGDRAPYQPERYGQRWAPVLVGWARPHEAGLPLRDVDRGIGVPVAVGRDGDRGYVSGQVVLNAERRDLEPGFEDRATSWGATLVHELAHVLGLGHVDDPDQLMHIHPGSGPVQLGEGDRAGLRAVGGEAGCRPAPEPRPVELGPVGQDVKP